MELQEEIKSNLENIKRVKGVENVILTQRDGNPIQSAGVWLSKDEIFTLSSATSAIYNVGLHLHQEKLKYILIEGKFAKIFLAPLKNSMKDPIDRIMIKQGIKNNNEEFFIAITSFPNVNLGGIFLQTRETLKNIKRSLILSGQSFKPPLRKYETEDINKIINSFNSKENSKDQTFLNINSFSFSTETIKKIDLILRKIARNIISMSYASISTSGGFLISKYLKNDDSMSYKYDHQSAMSYSLYSTANRCAWLLKKMKINSILLECETYFQFISPIGDGIFNLLVDKGSQKLGLLRLILPRYLILLNKTVNEAKLIKNPVEIFDLKRVLGEISLK